MTRGTRVEAKAAPLQLRCLPAVEAKLIMRDNYDYLSASWKMQFNYTSFLFSLANAAGGKFGMTVKVELSCT